MSDFALAWFSSLSSKHFCVFNLHCAIYYIQMLISFSLPFSDLNLVGLALDVVDYPSSFSTVTLLVGSSDP